MSNDLSGEIENTPSLDENVESSTTPEVEVESVEDAETSATETPEEPKKANKVQERINQLTREKYEERQKNAELEARLAKLEASNSQAPEPEIIAPKEEDYDDYSQFQMAQAKFVADTAANAAYNRIAAENQTRQQKDAESIRQQELQSKKEAFEKNVNSKRANFQDFENVAYGHEFMDLDLAEQIFEMDKGPEVAYHLGSHLDDAARIYALPPVQRARELTKLEFALQAITPKKVSSAPDPITPLGHKERVETDPDKMTADEWQKWRYEQLQAKGR